MEYVVQPIVYFHQDEDHFPSSIRSILTLSEGYVDDCYKIACGVMNTGNLKACEEKFQINRIVPNPLAYGGDSSMLAPMYYTHYNINHAEKAFQYVFLFAAKSEGKRMDVGDIHRVTIVVKKLGCFITRMIVDGKKWNLDEIEIEQGRPILYCAKNSHQMYPKKGNYGWCCSKKQCQDDIRWSPSMRVLYHDGWCTFQGNLGSTPFLKNSHWYRNEL